MAEAEADTDTETEPGARPNPKPDPNPNPNQALAKLGAMLPLIEYINQVNETYLTAKGLTL